MAVIRPEDEELTIKTGGKTLGGWTNFRVTRGIELLPSNCLVELTEKYPDQVGEVSVDPFSTCEVFLGQGKTQDQILTGYIDVYQPEFDAQHHGVSIACRSRTEDLIDCSIDVDALSKSQASWEIRAATIGAAAEIISKPFGIEVKLPDDNPALDPRHPFIVAPGMTAYQSLEEMARTVQMLLWDDADGNLVISRAGKKRAATALVEGQNCEAAAARLSGDQRYSRVIVLAQSQVTDQKGPHLPLRAERTDTGVPSNRNRLLIVVSDVPGPDLKWVEQRADREISRRYGRSRRFRVTVTGWRDGAGVLWTPNTLVAVEAPSLKFKGDLLIWQATWLRSERGTQTILDLMPREGVLPPPFPFAPPITLDPNVKR